MDVCQLFRRHRQRRSDCNVALYVRECSNCLELSDGHDRVECLQGRITGKANKTDIMVGICCTTPNKDEEVNGMSFNTLGELVLWPSEGQTLACLGVWLRELYERQS